MKIGNTRHYTIVLEDLLWDLNDGSNLDLFDMNNNEEPGIGTDSESIIYAFFNNRAIKEVRIHKDCKDNFRLIAIFSVELDSESIINKALIKWDRIND